MIDKEKELFNKHNVVLYQGVRLYKADFFDYVNKYEYSRPYIIKINNKNSFYYFKCFNII